MIEKFSKRLLASKIFDTYVAAVFFASLIFFVVNAQHYTPFEIIFSVVIITIAFKGIANVMLAMIISLFDLENEQDRMEFEEASNRLESLVKDLAIKEAAVQSAKNNDK